MSLKKEFAVKFTAREKAELLPADVDNSPLKPDELFSHTLVSLISCGTETVGCYSGNHYQMTGDSYPRSSGYASISRVEQVGSDVKDIVPGDLVLGGCHQSYQRGKAVNFAKVPAGLAPEIAVFGRMAKISIPAIIRSAIRPPENMIVTGLGLVGMLAAQLGQNFGYQVLACDPNAGRREIARQCGIINIMDNVPVNDQRYAKKVGFGLDCSGHEQAVLDLCNIVRTWGEVSMVGVPWVPKTSMLAQKILHSVFYNFVSLKSGWECQMPPAPDIHSDWSHHLAAMRWLAEGRLKITPCVYRKVPPDNPQQQYQDILNNRLDELTVMFDWRQL